MPARRPNAPRLRDFARAVVAGLAFWTGAIAQEDGRVAAERLLYADAKQWVEAAEPAVRGEAALVLAASGDDHAYPLVLGVAEAEASDASLRGILALGYLATPGTAASLERLLEAENGKSTPRALCAAFALASLPGEQGDLAINQLLSRMTERSWKRQGDLLLAVLAALVDRGPDAQRAVLLRLFDDASMRDPALRAAVLAALAEIPGATTDKQLHAALASPSAELRAAALAALATKDAFDRDWLAVATQLAQRDESPIVRANALLVLTNARHLPALDLAAKALRSDDVRLVAQAVRTGQHLGGEPMRRTLERQFAHLATPAQIALLEEIATPVSAEFATECREVVPDAARDEGVRTAALLLLARNGEKDLGDELAAAFARATDPQLHHRLARAYGHAIDGDPKALLDAVAVDSAAAAGRLAALLHAGSAGASRFCIERLRRTDLPPGPGAVLRALRRSRLPQLGETARRIVPEPVRSLLVPDA